MIKLPVSGEKHEQLQQQFSDLQKQYNDLKLKTEKNGDITIDQVVELKELNELVSSQLLQSQNEVQELNTKLEQANQLAAEMQMQIDQANAQNEISTNQIQQAIDQLNRIQTDEIQNAQTVAQKAGIVVDLLLEKPAVTSAAANTDPITKNQPDWSEIDKLPHNQNIN